MFLIVVTDSKGKIVGRTEASRYIVMAEIGEQFHRLFSDKSAIDQLGLIEFAKLQVKADLNNSKKE